MNNVIFYRRLLFAALIISIFIPFVDASSNWTYHMQVPSGWYDPTAGTYTQYLLQNFTSSVSGNYSAFRLAMDYGTAVMLPWMAVWGWYIFIVIWCSYIMMVWIGSGTIEVPLAIGILSGTLWGLLFPANTVIIFSSLIIVAFAVVLFRLIAPKE